MTNKFPETIAEAAKLLDRKKRGWFKKINKDKLDMTWCRNCILGQLYLDYSEGFHILFPGVHVDCTNDKIFGNKVNKQIWIDEINQRLYPNKHRTFKWALEQIKDNKTVENKGLSVTLKKGTHFSTEQLIKYLDTTGWTLEEELLVGHNDKLRCSNGYDYLVIQLIKNNFVLINVDSGNKFGSPKQATIKDGKVAIKDILPDDYRRFKLIKE